MASRYQFSDEEIKAIEQARRENKDKRAEARLKALELRVKGASSKDVAEATGFCSAYVSQLVAKYRHNGLEAISGNHYGGNHRNMSVEEEAAILAPFKARAEKGELVEISEIAKAYQSAVDLSLIHISSCPGSYSAQNILPFPTELPRRSAVIDIIANFVEKSKSVPRPMYHILQVLRIIAAFVYFSQSTRHIHPQHFPCLLYTSRKYHNTDTPTYH